MGFRMGGQLLWQIATTRVLIVRVLFAITFFTRKRAAQPKEKKRVSASFGALRCGGTAPR